MRNLRRILCLALLIALLSGCALAASPYAIEVDITNQIVTVYRAEDMSEGGVVRQMICSTGENECTPVGRFTLNQRNSAERTKWYAIPTYDCYVQYVTRIIGGYLFHSLPYAEEDESTLVRLRDHALKGNWKGYRELHIDADWLLIYQVEREELELVLVRSGSHDSLL